MTKAIPNTSLSRTLLASALASGALAAATPASAERIENGVAVFSALDKVTATIKKLEVPLNETVEFGALKVTPRVCYSRPPTEQPKTTTFVEVDEVGLDGGQKRLFTGWMFAESPALNAVEHPVFDVWLTGCAQPKSQVAQRPVVTPAGDAAGANVPAGEAGEAPPADLPRRRVRR